MKRITIKLLLLCLFAISLAFVCSCSTTRKIANENTAQHVDTSVKTDKHEQSQKSEAVNERTTETDFSTAVIEFTKTEYTDGTTDICTCTHEATDTTLCRDRESAKPPNVGKNIKSVTSGKITLNNNKTKQTDTNIESAEASQIDESVEAEQSEDTTTDIKTEEKDKHGFFFYFGVIVFFCIIFALVSFVAYVFRQIIIKK